MPKPKPAHFPPDALHFLADLEAHNDRDWFERNRDRFFVSLRDPYLLFLTDLGPKLAGVSKRFVVDPAPVGGSLARIHRDMRFVRDGLPYKTALSAHFAHEKAKDDGATPSFFLYLEPGRTRLGAGIRNAGPSATKAVQKAIAKDEPTWRKLVKATAPDKLVATLHFADEDVSSPHFLNDVVMGCKKLAPFARFVTEAVGLEM